LFFVKIIIEKKTKIVNGVWGGGGGGGGQNVKVRVLIFPLAFLSSLTSCSHCTALANKL